jgi:hypothetical protein
MSLVPAEIEAVVDNELHTGVVEFAAVVAVIDGDKAEPLLCSVVVQVIAAVPTLTPMQALVNEPVVGHGVYSCVSVVLAIATPAGE